MLDGATPAPLMLIVNCEFFCLFHVDETCFKLYDLNIVHTTSPCKHIVVYLLFDHCLLVEGSQSLDVVSLIVCLVLPGMECFCLQELFEGWRCLYLHQIQNLFPVCLESEDGDPDNARDPIV